MKVLYLTSIVFLFVFSFFSYAEETVSYKGELQINKDVIEKKEKYLLRGFISPQRSVLLGRSIQSRVVFFKRRGDKIYMFNASEGQVINPELSDLVFAEFKILKKKRDYVVIDWSQGMGKVYGTADFVASDFGLDHPFKKPVFQAHLSYIKEIRFHSNTKEIHIHQVLGVQNNNQETHYQAFYILSPYKVNEGFEPREDKKDKFLHYGFFESHPVLNDKKESVMYTGKWDIRKPIVFYMSSNTPKEYIQAVKDGVLYWNRAFKKEILSVKMAPENEVVHLPHAHTKFKNVIHWLDINFNFAYADMTMDPLTGEIIQGASYLGMGDGRRDHFLIEVLQKGEFAQPQPHRDFENFEVHDSHEKTHHSKRFKSYFLDLRENLMALDEVEQIRIGGDFITSMVAHEIGHVLGLRHNFAGSLHKKDYVTPEILKQAINHYFKKDELADLVLSSSVMDYLNMEENLLIGASIRKKPDFILEYDKLAIEVLYYNKKINHDDTSPLFCTDSQIHLYADCNRHDSFPIIKETLLKIKALLSTTPVVLSLNILKTGKTSLPVNLAEHVELYMKKFLSFFQEGTNFLSIERKFAHVNSVIREGIMREEKLKFLEKEFQSLGENPFNDVLSLAFPKRESRWPLLTVLKEKVLEEMKGSEFEDTQNLSSGDFNDLRGNFLSLNPLADDFLTQTLSGNDTFDRQILNEDFLKQYEYQVTTKLLTSLSSIGKHNNRVEKGPWIMSLEESLRNLLMNHAFHASGEFLTGSMGEGEGEGEGEGVIDVKVPIYTYEDENSTPSRRCRMLSLTKTSPHLVEVALSHDWLLKTKHNLVSQFKEHQNHWKKTYGDDFFERHDKERVLNQWTSRQIDLGKSLEFSPLHSCW